MMKKLLLIGLVAAGLSFAAVPRSDAQVYFSIIRTGLLRILPSHSLLSVSLLPAPMAIGLTIDAAGTVTTKSPSLLSVLFSQRRNSESPD